MNEKLLERYRRYARSGEAFAVLLAKKHLAETKGHWVDIVDFRHCRIYPDSMHFRFVVGGLFKRKIQPKYPLRSSFSDEAAYYLMTRAITWETAHKDMEQQKSKGVIPVEFEIEGVSYDKNRNKKGYFRDDAPAEIKALEKNLNDRTDPLWDKAMKYIMEPDLVYEVRQARIVPSPDPRRK